MKQDARCVLYKFPIHVEDCAMKKIHCSMLILMSIILITISGIIFGLVPNCKVGGYVIGGSTALLGLLDIILMFYLLSKGDPAIKNPDYFLNHMLIILACSFIAFLFIFSKKGYWLQYLVLRD